MPAAEANGPAPVAATGSVTAIGWNTPLADLVSLGILEPRAITSLATLKLRSVGDLLGHYPRKYGEPGKQIPLEDLAEGEYVSVVATVESAMLLANQNGGYRLVARVSDGVRELTLTFFGKHPNSLAKHEKALARGRVGVFTGTVSKYRDDYQLTHPDYSLLPEVVTAGAGGDEAELLRQAAKPIPIYRANAKAPTWEIRKAVAQVLAAVPPGGIPDPIPAELLEQEGLMGKLEALRQVHQPEGANEWEAARQRLRHEEAFVLQTALALRREAVAADWAKPRAAMSSGSRLAQFDSALPFALTNGQREIGAVIASELAGTHPMQRLLIGEVGSGKTLVALRAMLQVIDGGGQAAFLAPTEILAQQHARTFERLLGQLAETGFRAPKNRVQVALLTGSGSTGKRRGAMLSAISGEAGILVGTHALLEDRVKFFDLGLVVVDEQQRFGVEQREALRGKGSRPHLLVMTATPIPRTIAMTAFGDMDISELKDMPPGRQPITTKVFYSKDQRLVESVWRRVAQEVAAGHRVFVVCPRIADNSADDDDDRAVANVEAALAELRANEALRGVAIEELHGQMDADAKEAAMRRFASGETQMLVSTTVVEVGVDIPEATVMVVLDADRFGVSQLHQLRGRVGRGNAPGYCLLFTGSAPDTPGGQRLAAVRDQPDGFALAQFDLEQRAEGDVLGANQAGRNSSLRLLKVAKHGDVIAAAREQASQLVREDPTLSHHPDLRAAVGALGQHQEFLGMG